MTICLKNLLKRQYLLINAGANIDKIHNRCLL